MHRLEKTLLHVSPTQPSSLLPSPSSSSCPQGRPFDPIYLRRLIEGEYMEAKDLAAQTIVEDDIFNHTYGMSTQEFRLLTKKRLEKCFSMDWVQLKLIKENPEKAMIMSEAMAMIDLSFAVKTGVHSTLFTGAILLLGSDEQINKYEPLASSLAISGCFAMTESGHGSNVRQIETLATFQEDTKDFILHTPTESAAKWYIGNALNATHGVVFARLIHKGNDYGPHAFIAQLRENGQLCQGVQAFDNGEKAGLHGVDNGIIKFTNLRIPRENMLCKFSQVTPQGDFVTSYKINQLFNVMISALTVTRIALINSALCTMKLALTIATRYGMKRQQFGPPDSPEWPIMEYTTHQRRLMPFLASSFAMTFGRKWVTAQWHNLDHTNFEKKRRLEAIIAGMKALSTWEMRDAVQNARECCGGQGYLAVNRIGGLRADSDIFVTFEGDNTVLLQLVAKELLVGYSKKFTKSSFRAALTFFNMNIVNPTTSFISKIPPFSSGDISERSLRSFSYLRSCFLYMESNLLHSAAMRLRFKIQTAKQDGMAAWNDCLDHLLLLSRCHIERVTYENFYATAKKEKDVATAKKLRMLCDLYALSRLESKRVWFLEHGYFTAQASKLIRQEVEKLCKETKESALELVEAFGIRDELLGAPIATK